jgi:hypothetical protein
VGASSDGREPRGASLEAASAGHFLLFLAWGGLVARARAAVQCCMLLLCRHCMNTRYNAGVNTMQAMAETRHAVAWRVLGHP